jgi:nitrite reductase/ring-hydroxylating ferredoxin subunit
VSDGRDRRVGLLHGLTQTIAIVLVTASVVLRIVDVAAGAVALLAAGTGLSLASAYLGGHLVLGRGVMVDHNAWTVGPRQWTSTVAVAELEDGRPQMADVDGRQILVTRVDGVISAIENACSHAGGPLSMGAVRDGTVTCPWHGSCFRLRDGAVLNGPAQAPQPMLETRVREGVVQVRGRRVPRTVETNH